MPEGLWAVSNYFQQLGSTFLVVTSLVKTRGVVRGSTIGVLVRQLRQGYKILLQKENFWTLQIYAESTTTTIFTMTLSALLPREDYNGCLLVSPMLISLKRLVLVLYYYRPYIIISYILLSLY